MPVNKKGKARKVPKSAKKVSASPRQQVPCDSEDVLRLVLHRVLHWLQANYARAIDLLRKFDVDQDNRLSCDDFIIGMRLLEAPVTRLEINQLISVLDVNKDGEVNFLELDQTIRREHERLLARSVSPGTEETDSNGDSTGSRTFSLSQVSVKCPNCEIGIAEPPTERNPRFVLLRITLAPFKDFHSHPGHFELEVTDSTSVQGLKELIQVHLGEVANSIALFKEAKCGRQSYLAPSLCLERCGLVGGPKSDPVHAEVFYDYMPAVMDCPILMTDSHIKEVEGSSGRTRNHTHHNSSKH